MRKNGQIIEKTSSKKENKYTLLEEKKETVSKDPLVAAFTELSGQLTDFITILNLVGIRKIDHPFYNTVVESSVHQLLITITWLFNVATIIEPDWLKKNFLTIQNQLTKPPFPNLITEAKAENSFNQLFKKIVEEIDDPNKYLKMLLLGVESFISIDPGLMKSSEMNTKQKIIFESYELLAKRNPLVVQHACEYLHFLDQSNIIAQVIPELEQINRKQRAAEIKQNMGAEGIESQERKKLNIAQEALLNEIETYDTEQAELASQFGEEYFAIQKQNTRICSLVQMKCMWEELVCVFEYASPKLTIFLTDVNSSGKLMLNAISYTDAIIKFQSQIEKSIDEFSIRIEYAVENQNTSLSPEVLIHIFLNCRTSVIKIMQIFQQPWESTESTELTESSEGDTESKHSKHSKQPCGYEENIEIKRNSNYSKPAQLKDITHEFAKIITNFRLVLETLPAIASSSEKNSLTSLKENFSNFLVSMSSSSSSSSSTSSTSSSSSVYSSLL